MLFYQLLERSCDLDGQDREEGPLRRDVSVWRFKIFRRRIESRVATTSTFSARPTRPRPHQPRVSVPVAPEEGDAAQVEHVLARRPASARALASSALTPRLLRPRERAKVRCVQPDAVEPAARRGERSDVAAVVAVAPRTMASGRGSARTAARSAMSVAAPHRCLATTTRPRVSGATAARSAPRSTSSMPTLTRWRCPRSAASAACRRPPCGRAASTPGRGARICRCSPRGDAARQLERELAVAGAHLDHVVDARPSTPRSARTLRRWSAAAGAGGGARARWRRRRRARRWTACGRARRGGGVRTYWRRRHRPGSSRLSVGVGGGGGGGRRGGPAGRSRGRRARAALPALGSAEGGGRRGRRGRCSRSRASGR